tara:strand:+ start:2831 stop:3169 length:339 start_codon:yes stop_codon:yes gene_type:complete
VTDEEADKCLLLMSQLWFKSFTMPDGTLKIWHSQLKQIDYDNASEAVSALAREKSYWPSIQEFHDSYQAVARRNKPEIRAIEGPSLSKEERVANIRKVREHLQSIGKVDFKS